MRTLDITLLEAKAKEEKKSISCLAISILFFLSLGVGLYYSFVDDIIFNYDNVSPLSGFFIFFAIGSVLIFLVSFLYGQYWKSHNIEIDKANEDIVTLLQSGILSDVDFFRLKKDYIERKLKNRIVLTSEEFHWHTNHICWCCGETYKDNRTYYMYEKSRTVRWKEGGFRKSRTYKKTAKIHICLDCYKKITAEYLENRKNSNFLLKVDIAVSSIITICFMSYYVYTDILNSNYTILGGIGMALFYLIAIVGICCSFGQIIIYPLTYLVSYPFLDKNTKYVTPKWSFDNIPEIKKFISMDLPSE